ncbi:zinc finger protein 223-like isoform X2 [Contarinia nasturtii]|uniref:zinc finger protein 223-like isoform X2 n=1 Tax=Contarinia nasturtii TaxID=265458 RepID=UPI0012D3ABEC|nr:zinc finger protein 223-like isoform X2 [Contarinia nasturtii]
MAEEYNLILNSNEMCRNCLAKNTAPNLKSLFRCDIVDGEIWSIPDLYKDIIGIELNENDGFPKNICTKCEKTMFEAFIFRQKSRKSHKLLQRILKMSKHEESEADIYEVEVIEKINSDYIEGDGETVWQTMYLSNVETDNVIIEQDFTSSESLEIKNQLDLSKDVICEICCEQVSQSLLETHFNQHSIIMPSLVSSIEFYRCSRCLMCFPYINLLLEHANAEHLCDRSTELDKEPSYQNISKEPKFRLFSTCKNIDNFTFSCCLCILDFENLFAFRAHFQEHLINLNTHPEYIRSDLAHACGVCGEKFRNLGDCLNHVYFHQTTYACYKTNCKHVTFTSLYFHLIREHSHHNCKFCLFQAKTSNELKEHQRFSCSARQMKCDHCERIQAKNHFSVNCVMQNLKQLVNVVVTVVLILLKMTFNVTCAKNCSNRPEFCMAIRNYTVSGSFIAMYVEKNLAEIITLLFI